MDDIMQVPLNLPDVRVLSTQRTEQGHWLIRVESTLAGPQCRRCGREIRDLQGSDAVVRRRHLPLCDRPVLLEIRPQRDRCPYGAGPPTTTQRLLGDGKALVEWVMAFTLSIGFQLAHKATCRGGGCLTRHSHYVLVRLGGLTIWRLQCTMCRAVFTILPHFFLRYRQMRPEVARDALLATHGGLSLERCAVISYISPTALYRFVLRTRPPQCGQGAGSVWPGPCPRMSSRMNNTAAA